MSKPHTYDFIKSEFQKRGYCLLSKEYKNVSTKLEYICSNGHKHSIEYRHFKSGHGCLKCVGINNSKRFRLDIDIIRDSFISSGYELLTTEYINAHQQLQYTCPYGHTNKMTWNNWSKGYRCPICYVISISGENNYNWKGGASYEPYCSIFRNKSFKDSIKQRDNYKCQNPDCWKKEGVASRLSIHHIDHDKKNCEDNNLITLCNSCNARANINRNYWKSVYNNIINRRLSV
ncbi:MAG: hypothetical protein WC346_15445 [Methanogenium sp.]